MTPERDAAHKGSLILDVWFLARLTERWLGENLTGTGFSADEFGFCSALAVAGESTASELTDLVGLPASTLSSMTNRLHKQGILTSLRHPGDGRARIWDLSPTGWERLDQATQQFRAAYLELVRSIGLPATQVRDALAATENAVRHRLEVPARPVEPGEEEPSSSLAYEGPVLSAADAEEARRYIDWLRFRDGAGSASTGAALDG